MGFCTNCGNQTRDEDFVCGNCGTRLVNGVEQPPVMYGQQEQYNGQFYQGQNVAQAPAIGILQRSCASPLFLVMLITYIAQVVFGFLNKSFPSSAGMENLISILNKYGLDTYAENLNNRVNASDISSGIIGLIPEIFIIIGLILFYSSVKNAQFGRVETAGLTMVKVINVIYLVLVSIATALIEIVFLIGAFGVFNLFNTSISDSSESFASVVGILFGILFVMFGVVFTFIIIYYAKIIKTINAVKETMITGAANNNISSFVIVMNYILAGFAIITTLSSLFMLNILGALTNAAGATFYITVSLLLSSYKREMTYLKMQSGF